MADIQFVYFDVGGVIVLDFSKTNKWEDMKRDLNIPPLIEKEFEKLYTKYEIASCLGDEMDLFMEIAKKKFGIRFPKNYSILEDVVSRFEVNEAIHPLLDKHRNNYKMGLLTDMYKNMFNLIETKGLFPNIEWDNVVDSSLEGYRKPHKQIYKIAEMRAETDPESILFVENKQENIDAARKRGWQTFLYDPANPKSSTKELDNLLSK